MLRAAPFPHRGARSASASGGTVRRREHGGGSQRTRIGSNNWGLSGSLPSGLRQAALEGLSIWLTQACAPAARAGWLATMRSFNGRLCRSGPEVIDVAVVHTPAARDAAGGVAAIEAEIDLMVAWTNRAYEAGGVHHGWFTAVSSTGLDAFAGRPHEVNQSAVGSSGVGADSISQVASLDRSSCLSLFCVHLTLVMSLSTIYTVTVCCEPSPHSGARSASARGHDSQTRPQHWKPADAHRPEGWGCQANSGPTPGRRCRRRRPGLAATAWSTPLSRRSGRRHHEPGSSRNRARETTSRRPVHGWPR